MKNTLILGLYVKDKRSACMGSLETDDGMQTGIVQWAGEGIASALHKILQDVQPIGARRLVVLCNHPGLVGTFTNPIRLALPEVCKEGKKLVPCGNENMWAVARDLCHYEQWRIVYLENLPKARELWNDTFTTNQTGSN